MDAAPAALSPRPVTAADIEAQSSWLISAWDSLAKIRPEFGKLSTPARYQQRKYNLASTAVVIYGVIGAMSTTYAEHIDPEATFKALAITDDGHDLLAWDNPRLGARRRRDPTGTDSGTVTTRDSFPARRAATRVLQEIMDLDSDPDD